MSEYESAEPPEEQPSPPPDERAPHPVRLVVSDDLGRSRLTVFFRLILAIPHVIWIYFWTYTLIVCLPVMWFAALIAGHTPEDLHLFLARYIRYRTHVTSYVCLVSNPYPTFFGREGKHPIDVSIAPPERQPRLVTFFRLVLAIPAVVLAYVLSLVMVVVAFLGWFVCLAIGRMPKGMRDLSAYCLRYDVQTYAYLALLTSRYPSLTGSPMP